MKALKLIFKILIVCALLVAVLFAAIALYVKFYGKNIIEDALSNTLGTKIKFDNISMNLEQYTVNFKGFTIPSEIGFEKNIFNAEEFTLSLNEEKFEKEKKIVFDKVTVKKAVVNIERNKKGIFNVSYRVPECERGVAYADTPSAGGAINIYNFAKKVKELYIRDSEINFTDYFVPGGPFAITCDSFNVNFTDMAGPKEGDIVLKKCVIKFSIPTRRTMGSFTLDGVMDITKDKVGMNLNIYTQNIDLMEFLPYFNSYTPFSFYDGVFNSETRLIFSDNNVDSLTTMYLRRLRLSVDPGKENAVFLEATVDKLAPYLMSARGELVFDFVIKGPPDNPRIGVGPQVKYAIGMVVMEEVGKILQQLSR